MSKEVKNMQIDSFSKFIGDSKNFVLLSMSGVPALEENTMRLKLREKNIRMQLVKNTLALKVLKDNGFTGLDSYFNGPTVVAHGGSAVAELAKELDVYIRKFSKKITAKIAVAEGSPLSFEAAKKLPTRLEAIGLVVGAILGPGSSIAGALRGPGGKLAGAVKTISEKTDAPAA